MSRLHRSALGLLACLVLGTVAHAAAPKPAPRVRTASAMPRILFFGVWDRAKPSLNEAAQAAGFSAGFAEREHMPSPRELADVDMLLVLNVDAAEAAALTERVRAARALGTRPRVLALDHRDSQTSLRQAGLLEPDDRIAPYWKANGPANLKRLFGYLGIRYFGRQGTVEAPLLIPESGYYLPGHADAFATLPEFSRAAGWRAGAPVAAILIQQSFWITQDTRVVDALVAALARQGFNVATLFSEQVGTIERLVREVKPDILVEDRHGSMWADARGGLLAELDVPYLRPISMLASTVDEWRANPQGLTARDRGMFMSLQELLGTIEPMVVGGLQFNASGFKLHEPIPDRVERFAARARAWADLRRTRNADKRVAIVYYNKYLGKGDLGRGSPTGAFMDGPESLVKFLPRMKARGFTIDRLPADAAELVRWMQERGRNVGPWAQADLEALADQPNVTLVPVEKYRQWYARKLPPALRAAVEKQFGPPPGRLMVVRRNGRDYFVIPGIRLGNVMLLPQPERGETQDESLLHAKDIAPPHNYLAFHWWLQEEFRPHAMVPWGTHGSLELLPGKEAGLASTDWSDINVGTIPVIYPWIMDNLAESTLARRRAYAVLVDHLPPLATRSALPDELRRIHDDITKFESLEQGLLRQEFRKRISSAARAQRIPGVPGGAALLDDEAIEHAGEWLDRQAEETTPRYLHVMGRAPTDAQALDPLVASLRGEFLDRVATVTPPPRSLPAAQRRDWLWSRARDVVRRSVLGGEAPPPALADDVRRARALLADLRRADREIAATLEALEGRFVRPGPGPDPVRNPSAAPGGRNLYGLNPEEIPTRASYAVATRLIDALLAQHHPGKVGIDLNGMETMRDFGVTESEVLYLLGVRPRWDHNDLAVDVELIPRAELKRPRVDVFVAMGGQYKENFPSRVKLLDKAVRLAAAADEPDNGVRAGTERLRAALLKRGLAPDRAADLAAARIFGSRPGNMSGTNILYLIPRSGVWESEREISSVYVDTMSFVYSGEHWGERVDGLYESAIQGTDTVVRVWASNMTSQLSNHHAYEYLGGLSMAIRALTGREPQAFIADVRNPDAARLRSFEEVLESNLRGELLNREWLAGMKAHDYAGAGHVAELVKNTFGWTVTRKSSVDPRVWNDIHDVVVRDRYGLGLRAWFEKQNPAALQEIAATMLEAARKGYWKADPAVLKELAELYAQLTVKYGAATGIVGGGNQKLDQKVAQLAPGLAAAFAAKVEAAKARPAGEQILGRRLERAAPPKAQKSQATPRAEPPRNELDWWKTGVLLGMLTLILAGIPRRTGAAA